MGIPKGAGTKDRTRTPRWTTIITVRVEGEERRVFRKMYVCALVHALRLGRARQLGPREWFPFSASPVTSPRVSTSLTVGLSHCNQIVIGFLYSLAHILRFDILPFLGLRASNFCSKSPSDPVGTYRQTILNPEPISADLTMTPQASVFRNYDLASKENITKILENLTNRPKLKINQHPSSQSATSTI